MFKLLDGGGVKLKRCQVPVGAPGERRKPCRTNTSTKISRAWTIQTSTVGTDRLERHLRPSRTDDVLVDWKGQEPTHRVEQQVGAMKAYVDSVRGTPPRITSHPIAFGSGEWTCVIGEFEDRSRTDSLGDSRSSRTYSHGLQLSRLDRPRRPAGPTVSPAIWGGRASTRVRMRRGFSTRPGQTSARPINGIRSTLPKSHQRRVHSRCSRTVRDTGCLTS